MLVPSVIDSMKQERRRSARRPFKQGTFAHRISSQEVTMVRIEITDLADEGIGVLSLIPLRPGERVAVGIIHVNAEHEVALCQVQHTGKSDTGQQRAGMAILERMAGDFCRTRVPASWQSS